MHAERALIIRRIAITHKEIGSSPVETDPAIGLPSSPTLPISSSRLAVGIVLLRRVVELILIVRYSRRYKFYVSPEMLVAF